VNQTPLQREEVSCVATKKKAPAKKAAKKKK
jgi:hypothetical protein